MYEQKDTILTVKKTDNELLNFLEKKLEGDILEELKTIWQAECKTEENKSHRIWEIDRYGWENTSEIQ